MTNRICEDTGREMICVLADSEYGLPKTKEGYDKFLEMLGFDEKLGDFSVSKQTGEKVDEYGGRFDKVTIWRDTANGNMFKEERCPAATRDYINHIYLLVPVEVVQS